MTRRDLALAGRLQHRLRHRGVLLAGRGAPLTVPEANQTEETVSKHWTRAQAKLIELLDEARADGVLTPPGLIDTSDVDLFSARYGEQTDRDAIDHPDVSVRLEAGYLRAELRRAINDAAPCAW